jgi:predicted PurR-regulated permease PerM
MATETREWKERRRNERRVNHRLGDVTVPEFRRMLITTLLFVIVSVLFLWMVRTVVIASILGVIVAMYSRPVFTRLRNRLGSSPAAAITILGIVLPILALLTYSYIEIKDVATYVSTHQEEIVAKVDTAIRKLPFMQQADTRETIQRYVIAASNYGTRIPGVLQEALSGFAIAATIFIFTTFYVLVDARRISDYVRSKIPPRYSELSAALEANMRGVLYGAVYSTFLTQAIKSVILLVLFLAFQVPLAGVLVMLAFVIGFFPIVGSWSV